MYTGEGMLDYNIISKTQLNEIIAQNSGSEDIFAKTVSYSGIQNNFHVDIPEILRYEKQLQERKNDIEKFTNLAMSDCENLSHNDLVMELLKKDFVLSELSTNEDLLRDLGF